MESSTAAMDLGLSGRTDAQRLGHRGRMPWIGPAWAVELGDIDMGFVRRWRGGRGCSLFLVGAAYVLVVALYFVACVSVALADEGREPWWWWSHASAYGAESIHDGGYWDAEQQRYAGYYGHSTSWGWTCATPEMRRPDSPHYKWAVLTPKSYGVASRDPWLLGTYIEVRIPRPDGSYGQWQILPVIDAGPYGAGTPSVDNSPGWNWDITEPVVLRAGWDRVSQSRYHWDDRLTLYGRRDVMVRYRPDLGRFCPNWGYHNEPPRG